MVKLMPHPAYSPDLAPCDFLLFPKLKKKNKGVHFNSAEEARLVYNEALLDLAKEDWENCSGNGLEGWIYAYSHLVYTSRNYKKIIHFLLFLHIDSKNFLDNPRIIWNNRDAAKFTLSVPIDC